MAARIFLNKENLGFAYNFAYNFAYILGHFLQCSPFFLYFLQHLSFLQQLTDWQKDSSSVFKLFKAVEKALVGEPIEGNVVCMTIVVFTIKNGKIETKQIVLCYKCKFYLD